MKLATCPMRPTGITWLGQIPADWDFKRLKYCARAVTDKVDKVPEDRCYIGLESIESETGRILEREQPLTVEGGASLFERHDVLFGKLRPYLAKAWHATTAGACTSELLVMRPTLLEPRYLLYSVLNPSFIQVVDGSTYGAKMPRASWEFIGNLPQPAPSPPEQKRIADFLDNKLARLDELARKKKRQLALLAEKRQALISHVVTHGLNPNAATKPSGLPWLGNIPEHWQVKAVSYVFRLGRGRVISREEADANPGPYPVYSSQTENGGVFASIGTFDFEGDYLTWTTDGAYAGTVFRRSGRFTCTNVCGTLKPMTPEVNLSFACYAIGLETHRFVRLDINPKLMNNTMARVRFVFPPKEEQDALAEFLDSQLKAIDSVSIKIDRQLGKLREYRQALITATVTGQVIIKEEAA